MIKNPFTPAFGKTPMFLAGREKLLDDVISGLDNAPGDPNRTTIFIGPRGSGKTVLLSEISTIASGRGWVSVSITASSGMLYKIIEQLKDIASEFLPAKEKSRITGIQFHGFGFTRESIPQDQPTWRKSVTDILKVLDKYNIGVLITVDEISSQYREIIDMLSDYQHFVREDRNVALLMAGLPGNVDQLFQDKSVSFFRKSFQRYLEPISISDVRVSLKNTIEKSGRTIEANALDTMAQKTEGFPLMIQLIGYHVWKQSDKKKIIADDVASGIESANEDLERMILRSTLKDVSKKDMEFIMAMIQDPGDSQISDIANRMGVSANYASRYRIRLIHAGIISQVRRGEVIFSIPMIKDLLMKQKVI
jgi:predicted transcriptional regulator